MKARGATQEERTKIVRFLQESMNQLGDELFLKDILDEDRVTVIEDYCSDCVGFHGNIYFVVYGDSSMFSVVYGDSSMFSVVYEDKQGELMCVDCEVQFGTSDRYGQFDVAATRIGRLTCEQDSENPA